MTATTRYELSLEQRDYLDLGRRGYGAIPVCSLVEGELDRDILRAAVATVVDRHESLRLRLHPDEDRPRQSFAAPRGDTPAVWTEEALPEGSDPLSTLLRYAGTDSLDLVRHDPVQLHLLRQDGKRTHVLVLLDHLATDGWGSYLFHGELWHSYRALRRGDRPALPPLTYTYPDYIHSQARVPPERHLTSGEYWSAFAERYAAAGNGLDDIGLDRSPAAGRGDLIRRMGAGEGTQVQALAESLGLSANTVPLACLLLALWSLAGGTSTALSFLYAGRDRPSVRGLVGVFFRQVPLVIDEVPAGDVGGLLRKVAAGTLEAARHSRAPYSARLFGDMVARRRTVPRINIVYNQTDAQFGRMQPGGTQQLADDTVARFIDCHYWPGRWHAYQEPTLRLIVNGGHEPTLQAIFNDGLLPEERAREILDRMAVLLRAMSPRAATCSVRSFVQRELGAASVP